MSTFRGRATERNVNNHFRSMIYPNINRIKVVAIPPPKPPVTPLTPTLIVVDLRVFISKKVKNEPQNIEYRMLNDDGRQKKRNGFLSLQSNWTGLTGS